MTDPDPETLPPADLPTKQKKKLGRPPTLDRNAALSAAHDVIADRGFDRTRYADVSEVSGIPVTTLQHSFGSLKAMLLASVQQSTSSEIEFLTTRLTDETLTPWERLSHFITGAVQHTDDSKFWRVWMEFYALAGRDPELGAYAGGLYEQWWVYLEALIADGLASGDFTSAIAANPRHAAIAIDAIVDGLAITLIVRADGPNFELARVVALEAVASMLGYTGPVAP